LSHKILADASLYLTLERIDEELAAAVRAGGCRWCGGALHRADYERKPRGELAAVPAGWGRRLSLCCAREGCRRRHTPPSVRFLGRRCYIAAVVVVGTALRHGPTPMRVAQLGKLFGVDRRTLTRWRRWWHEAVRSSELWRRVRGRLGVDLDERRLPMSILESMTGPPRDRLIATLRLLAPLSASPRCAW